MTWGMPWLKNINQSSIFIDTINFGINETIIVNEQLHDQAIIGLTDFGERGLNIEALDVYNININNVYNGI